MFPVASIWCTRSRGHHTSIEVYVRSKEGGKRISPDTKTEYFEILSLVIYAFAIIQRLEFNLCATLIESPWSKTPVLLLPATNPAITTLLFGVVNLVLLGFSIMHKSTDMLSRILQHLQWPIRACELCLLLHKVARERRRLADGFPKPRSWGTIVIV